MDSKDSYSKGVQEQNVKSAQQGQEVLRAATERARERRGRYWDNWQPVSINDLVRRFAPDAVPQMKGVKVHWKSQSTGYEVVADVSGYARVRDMRPGPYKGAYLDINGNHVKDLSQLPNEGKAEYRDRLMRISHFQILKREKMTK